MKRRVVYGRMFCHCSASTVVISSFSGRAEDRLYFEITVTTLSNCVSFILPYYLGQLAVQEGFSPELLHVLMQYINHVHNNSYFHLKQPRPCLHFGYIGLTIFSVKLKNVILPLSKQCNSLSLSSACVVIEACVKSLWQRMWILNYILKYMYTYHGLVEICLASHISKKKHDDCGPGLVSHQIASCNLCFEQNVC